MIAMAISDTSRPYSTADAPRSVLAMPARRMRRYSTASFMVLLPTEIGCETRTGSTFHSG